MIPKKFKRSSSEPKDRILQWYILNQTISIKKKHQILSHPEVCEGILNICFKHEKEHSVALNTNRLSLKQYTFWMSNLIHIT